MTYTGESLEYYDAADGADLTLYGDVYYRTSDGRTIASGDVWRVWYRADWQEANRYLTDAGADVDVSWVVEVASGSGTLVAAETVDLSPPDTSASAGTALGTYPVSGAGTVVIPSVLMGAAEIVDGPASGQNMLRLECTSGSIDVQQIKIRVSPPGGFGGGWSDVYPSFTVGSGSSPSVMRETALDSGTADDADPEDAWTAAVGAETGPGFTGVFTDLGTSDPTLEGHAAGSVLAIGGTPFEWTGSVSREQTVAVYTGLNWATGPPIDTSLLTEGVDYVRPPTEIAGEDPSYLVQWVGSGGVEWLGTTGTATAYAQGELTTLIPSLHSASTDSLTVTPLGGGLVDVVGAGYTPGAAIVSPDDDTDQTVSVSLTAGTGRYFVVSVGYTGAFPAWPGWAPAVIGSAEGDVTQVAVSFPDLLSRRVMPAYRVWDPDGPAQEYPHQLIQRGDGLGFGSAKVLDPGTRQFSGRVFGTY